MRIFLDANILVTVLCNEYPRFTACARVLSLADDKRFEVWTSPLCLAIGAYFAQKKFRNTPGGRKKTREKIALLSSKLRITSMDEQCVLQAVADPKVNDLEDGMQYYAAMAVQCGHIITYDRKDFHFAKVPVVGPEEFLMREVLR